MAQTSSAVPLIASGNTLLSISADGHSTSAPDLAVFSAGVTSQGPTASQAMTTNAADMGRVVAAVKKAGIAEKDVQTSSISLNPVYGQPVMGPNGQVVQEPRIVGYQANNTVMIKQRDLKGFGKVLDSLVAAGATNISGPAFQIDKPDSALDQARLDAVTKARTRAALYAKAAGLRILRIATITEGSGYNPQPIVAMYAKSGRADSESTPVAPGEVETAVTVAMQFELAPLNN